MGFRRISRPYPRRWPAISALVAALMAAPVIEAGRGSSPTPTPWATATPTPIPTSGTPLAMSEFRLDLAAQPEIMPMRLDFEPEAPVAGGPPSAFRRLFLDVTEPRDPVPGVELGPLEHPPPWIVPGNLGVEPTPESRLQLHLSREFDRIIAREPAEQLHGRAPPLMLLDGDELIRAVGRLVRRIRERSRPKGARLARNGFAIIRVAESGGGSPEIVSIVPLAEGWVGDTVYGMCYPDGVCKAEGLPDAPASLLIVGRGGAVVAYPGGNASLDAALKPLGRVRLEPARHGLQVRIVTPDSGLVVPVVRWLNPKRGEWIEIDGRRGLYLPEGDYIVESRRGADAEKTPVRVVADDTVTVTIH